MSRAIRHNLPCNPVCFCFRSIQIFMLVEESSKIQASLVRLMEMSMSPACQLNGSLGRRKTAHQTPVDPPLQTARSATTPIAASKKRRDFDPHAFLATIVKGRNSLLFQRKQGIFAQGDAADAVFYIQTGKANLTVVSKTGKEATIGMLGEGDFFGEGSLAGQPLRMCSATAMTDYAVLRIDKKAMMEALHREHELSDLFVAYLLVRNIRYEEDLVDQLFNSSEKRLARILLLLAHFGKEGKPENVVPN
jgi:CRP/FNR family transcriptional regulator, cyclic AMP receptor protein